MKSYFHERPLIAEEPGDHHSFFPSAGKPWREDMPDLGPPDDATGNAMTWEMVPSKFRTSLEPLPAPWEDRFGPLRRGTVDDLVVVGQIGQSIDGRIATVTGHSKYINGPAG